MATRTTDLNRDFYLEDNPLYEDIPVIAADIIYAGSAVGDNGSGLARPLEAGDPFLGFAIDKADNAAGAASAINVRTRQRGSLDAEVTGVTGAGDKDATVYMSDDNTFTLTSTSNSPIGKVSRFISGTKVVVRFEAVNVRSI